VFDFQVESEHDECETQQEMKMEVDVTSPPDKPSPLKHTPPEPSPLKAVKDESPDNKEDAIKPVKEKQPNKG